MQFTHIWKSKRKTKKKRNVSHTQETFFLLLNMGKGKKSGSQSGRVSKAFFVARIRFEGEIKFDLVNDTSVA
jgi:hypothetical protein